MTPSSTDSLPPSAPVHSWFHIAPLWPTLIAALLLFGGSLLPWMHLFEAPLTTTPVQVAAAGAWREPLWILISLSTMALAMVDVPYRWHIFTGIALVYAIKVWFVLAAVSAWFHLNNLQTGRAVVEPAPIAIVGTGLYLLLAGCGLLFGSIVWQRLCKS